MTDPRTLWRCYEPYHALTYFSGEARDAYEEVGLRGFWRGYFAGRAAPLGPVGPGVATACFYGFHPGFVSRALPGVWSTVSPGEALAARLSGIDRAVRAHFNDLLSNPALETAARLLRRGAEACQGAGRTLFSANRDLGWPEEPHLALWHATTLAREHRGDGHVAVLVANGVGPCEAHVLRLAVDGSPAEPIKQHRGWSEDDWSAAVERIRSRGWLDDGNHLTESGSAFHDELERATDTLAAELTACLSEEDRSDLLASLSAVARRIAAADLIPYPNPIGLPEPPRSPVP